MAALAAMTQESLQSRVDLQKLAFLTQPQQDLALTAAKLQVKQDVTDDFIKELEDVLPNEKEVKFFKKLFGWVKVLKTVIYLVLRYKSVLKWI